MARLSKKKVTEALKRHLGNMTKAAEACGVSRTYFYQYVKKHDMQSVVDEARETLVDNLENKALEVAMRGSNSMLQFLLKNQGRHRGYADRLETETSGEQTITVKYDRSPPLVSPPSTDDS